MADETTAERAGPFWDFVAGRADPPPAAKTLGWSLVAIDPNSGTIEVAFDAPAAFTNPLGVVQGGFLAAMLDDTLGPALVATLPPGQFAPTLELKVNFPATGAAGTARRHGPDRAPRRDDRIPRGLTARRRGPARRDRHRHRPRGADRDVQWIATVIATPTWWSPC